MAVVARVVLGLLYLGVLCFLRWQFNFEIAVLYALAMILTELVVGLDKRGTSNNQCAVR